MKIIFNIIAIFICTQSTAQVELKFENDIKLKVYISEFDATKHQVDICQDNGVEYYCLIDKSPWFGMDIGMNPPKYQLDSIIFENHKLTTSLDVSGMYNPTFSGTIDKRHFNIASSGESYIINGWFSDGAGTYCARWLLRSNSQIRTLLSNDEGECFN